MDLSMSPSHSLFINDFKAYVGGICFFVYFNTYLFKNVYNTHLYTVFCQKMKIGMYVFYSLAIISLVHVRHTSGFGQIGHIIMSDAVNILTVGEIKSRLN